MSAQSGGMHDITVCQMHWRTKQLEVRILIAEAAFSPD